jgi:hypothetical protein
MITSPQPGKSLSNLLDAALEIQMDPEPKEQDKAFLTKQLVQVTLPHSSPGNVPIWKRKTGNLTLAIRSGWNHEKDEPIGYPFGSIPRLLLFWITTEALRTQSRKLELGASLAGFMRDIGLDPSTGGGKRLHQRFKALPLKPKTVFSTVNQSYFNFEFGIIF